MSEASKPRICILGTGWGVRVQLPLFRLAGFEVVALGVNGDSKVDQVQKQVGEGIKVSADWASLVALPEVDLVSIVTPPFLHKDQTIAALKAGKHVICDKPFALNVTEVEAMVAESRAHPNQLALVDHEMRVTEILKKARELIVEQKVIGKLLSCDVTGVMVKGFTAPWSWWDSKEQGGGGLGAVGSHKIDTLRFITNRKITKLSAKLTSSIKTRKQNGKDTPVTSDYGFNINCNYEGGVEGSIKISVVPYGRSEYTYRVIGDQGVVVMDIAMGVNKVGAYTLDGRRIIEIAEPGAPKEVDDNLWTRGTAVLATHLAELFKGDKATLIQRAYSRSDIVNFEDETLILTLTLDRTGVLILLSERKLHILPKGLYVQRVMDACHKSNDSGCIYIDV